MDNREFYLDVALLMLSVRDPLTRQRAFQSFSRLKAGASILTDPEIAALLGRGIIREKKQNDEQGTTHSPRPARVG
jgi:hypothetical protein